MALRAGLIRVSLPVCLLVLCVAWCLASSTAVADTASTADDLYPMSDASLLQHRVRARIGRSSFGVEGPTGTTGPTPNECLDPVTKKPPALMDCKKAFRGASQAGARGGIDVHSYCKTATTNNMRTTCCEANKTPKLDLQTKQPICVAAHSQTNKALCPEYNRLVGLGDFCGAKKKLAFAHSPDNIKVVLVKQNKQDTECERLITGTQIQQVNFCKKVAAGTSSPSSPTCSLDQLRRKCGRILKSKGTESATKRPPTALASENKKKKLTLSMNKLRNEAKALRKKGQNASALDKERAADKIAKDIAAIPK